MSQDLALSLQLHEFRKAMEDWMSVAGDRLSLIEHLVATPEAVFAFQTDPHQWSSQPCKTCTEISDIIKRPFGCCAKDRIED